MIFIEIKEFINKINRMKWQRLAVGGTSESFELRASSHAAIPPSWGMFAYSEEMSRVTRRHPGGNVHVGNPCNLFLKSVVSRMWNGNCVTQGCRKKLTELEMFSVGTPFEDTMGLPGFPGLCILDSR